MASITEHHTTAERPSALRRLGRSLLDAMTTYMEAQARTDRIQAYHAMSDAELAARGIAREDIVRHVYRDRFFL